MKSENSETIEKDSISHKISLIKSIINDFRQIINILPSKISKRKLKTLRSRLCLNEKAANDEKEEDGEYLQGIIDVLSGLKEHYLKKTKHHDYETKYKGVESIGYLFDEDENKDYYKPK